MTSALDSLHYAEPLLLLAVVLIAGRLFGAIAHRARLPRITGQIIGGVLIGHAGLLVILFFFARISGKLVSADLALRAARATDRVRRNPGLTLVPQAGVAVGLVLVIQEDPRFADLSGPFAAVAPTVVTLNEIVGPVLTRIALTRAGEVGRDRLRLIDFLQEEQILTDFEASTKEIAIERLVDLLIRTNSIRGVDRDELLASVMALSRDGLGFETPDGRPVHCMVLLGTAPDERDRHLQVLAALARTVGTDRAFQNQLFHSESAVHAYELLHGEESEGFNYFMEEALEG